MKDEPAYPSEVRGTDNHGEFIILNGGLTKREYFANSYMPKVQDNQENWVDHAYDLRAKIAIRQADALMKALNNPKED